MLASSVAIASDHSQLQHILWLALTASLPILNDQPQHMFLSFLVHTHVLNQVILTSRIVVYVTGRLLEISDFWRCLCGGSLHVVVVLTLGSALPLHDSAETTPFYDLHLLFAPGGADRSLCTQRFTTERTTVSEYM